MASLVKAAPTVSTWESYQPPCIYWVRHYLPRDDICIQIIYGHYMY